MNGNKSTNLECPYIRPRCHMGADGFHGDANKVNNHPVEQMKLGTVPVKHKRETGERRQGLPNHALP